VYARQAPEHVGVRTLPGHATQVLALAKPPSMSRGGGLWCEEGGGSARLIAEDRLKCFLFNLNKRNTKGKIQGFRAQVWRPFLSSITRGGAGALRSCDLLVGFSQAPEHVEGKGRGRVRTLPGHATQVLALAKPPSMSRGGGLWCEEEEVVLDS
jgi:hypothetical protein